MILQSSFSTTEVKTFELQDNGGTAWARITDTNIEYLNDKNIVLWTHSWNTIWPGIDNASDQWGDNYKFKLDGNWLVMYDGSDYFSIGYRGIHKFGLLPNDAPLRFMSPTGNSGVPYSYIIGTHGIYFLAEFKYCKISDFKWTEKDPYYTLYNDKSCPAKPMAIVELIDNQ
jgi:hypothetical protein